MKLKELRLLLNALQRLLRVILDMIIVVNSLTSNKKEDQF